MPGIGRENGPRCAENGMAAETGELSTPIRPTDAAQLIRISVPCGQLEEQLVELTHERWPPAFGARRLAGRYPRTMRST